MGIFKKIWQTITFQKTQPKLTVVPAPYHDIHPDDSSVVDLSNFDYAYQYTLVNEGGYSNDKADAGGATKFGITRATLAEYRKRATSVEDVKNLGLIEAKAIYRKNYWDVISLGSIGDRAVATAIYDMGVNFGPTTALKLAQKVVGYAQTGNMSGSLAVHLTNMPREQFINAFSSACLSRYRWIVAKKPTQYKFLKGWTNRANRLKTLI